MRRIYPRSRYGRWLVLHRSSARPLYYLCRCDCGVEKEVFRSSLLMRKSVSCGCHRREVQAALHRSHGEAERTTKTKEYRAWAAMKNRCYNERSPDYPDYGGRGIRVAEEWLHDYPAFLAYIGRAPSVSHSVDRVRVNGHYEPGNVRWATAVQQANNKRRHAR